MLIFGRSCVSFRRRDDHISMIHIDDLKEHFTSGDNGMLFLEWKVSHSIPFFLI
eukprot:TRINITY_DN9976_c0_g1_i1.p1 TRINITY_DN9976_c0_g1~~TRINITY_DN9976_c0_g1_i1.p1  ORF type:complete len:54 (-),score=7.59 TRINITY_DN9976_c0_g1_i1:262-423(-)